MLFLFAAYKGVSVGSVEYINKNNPDIWILQRNAWNILRGTSMLPLKQMNELKMIEGVGSVSPVLLILSTVKKEKPIATVYLAGFDPKCELGGPPEITEGTIKINDNEIILDESFAKKFGYKVGSKIYLQQDTLSVAGISTGTNALVIQYAFVTLARAEMLLGVPGIVTCYLIKAKDKRFVQNIQDSIKSKFNDVEVYDHETFLKNNIKEMETGFLPFIFTIAVMGIVVLTTILSLILSINILEQRKDLAVIKTLGAPKTFLPGIVIKQAMAISFAGSIVALILFFPLTYLIEKVSPEIKTISSLYQVISILAVVIAVSLISSVVSIRRLRKIYPMEVFK